MGFYKGLPLRMNTVRVKIQLVRMDHTPVDSVYKEVVGKENTRLLTIQAQNKMSIQSHLNPSMEGDITVSAGRLVFRRKDLDKHNIKIRKGDKIVEIDQVPVEFDVLEVQYNSALGGSNLLIFVIYGTAKERKSI